LYSPEIQAQIAVWRARALEGVLTVEELKQSTALLREGRASAAAASTSAKRKKAKQTVLSVEDLERELGIS
jgi:hypothetical protein